jgi:oligopeptide transport system substrate-binding protein
MLRGNKPAIALAVVGVMAVAACSSSSGSSGSSNGGGSGGSVNLATLAQTPQDTRVGKPGGTFRLSIVEPVSIDPWNAQESEGILVSKNLFDTLVTVDANGHVKKLLAQSYTANPTCTDWTFTLKPNQKFSNGEPLDAESIKRGMTRAALGSAASAVAYHMANVVGFDALQASKATDPTTVNFTGVTATGDTLKVALTAPDCEFDLKTAQPVFSPVPPEAGAATNTKFNNEPIGNGPFKMAQPWQHDKSITLVRNDNYTDGPKALLNGVDITINDGSSGSYEDKGFTNGNFDYARVAPDDLKAFAAKYHTDDPTTNAFIKDVAYGVTYLMPMVNNKPMNSVAGREAVSYAIDRDAIITGILKNSVTKATSLVPTPFETQGTFQPGICASCVKQDVTKAKALALQAGLPPGTKINLQYWTGAGLDGWSQAIAGELKDELGWTVNIQALPFKTVIQNMSNPASTGLFTSIWGADYPTSWAILYPLLATEPADNPGANGGRYSNKKFDALLAAGQAESDTAKRVADYRQAEQVAIGQDLAVIPLWYQTEYRVFNSKFVGVNQDFFDNPTLATIGLK